MNINFTARHTEISAEVKKYCERRLKSVEKLLGYPLEADIILSVEKYRQKAEIYIKTKRATLNAMEETHDMLGSIGVAIDHIERRAKKEREKIREKKRRKIRNLEAISSPLEREEQQSRVIRSQNYSLKPMSIEEAIFQFESSKNEVFVFRKFDSEKWAVLFRRKDGNFGLIEPE